MLRAGEPPVGEVFDPEDPSSIAAAVRRVAGDGCGATRRGTPSGRRAAQLGARTAQAAGALPGLGPDDCDRPGRRSRPDPHHADRARRLGRSPRMDRFRSLRGPEREGCGHCPGRARSSSQLVIQTVDGHPPIRARCSGSLPGRGSAALAHVLSATVRMAKGRRAVGRRGRRRRVERLVATLRELRTSHHAGSAWGYPFDMRSRFFYAAGTPNTIATSFAGLALLDAHALTGSAESLELAQGAGDFLLAEGASRRQRPRSAPTSGWTCLRLDPGPQRPTCSPARCWPRWSRRPAARTLARAARAGVASTRSRTSETTAPGPMRATPAATGSTACIPATCSTAFLVCAVALGFSGARAAHRRGLDYYASNLIAADGAAKAFDRSLYPIDGQVLFAQAIRSFTLAAALDRARLETAARVYEFAVRRMRRRDGAFVFQRHRRWVNPIPHVRWVQAPMLDALSMLYEAQAPGAEERGDPPARRRACESRAMRQVARRLKDGSLELVEVPEPVPGRVRRRSARGLGRQRREPSAQRSRLPARACSPRPARGPTRRGRCSTACGARGPLHPRSSSASGSRRSARSATAPPAW